MTRESRAEYRRKDAATNRDIAAELARQQSENAARYKALRAVERAENAARRVFTRDDVLGATQVRTTLSDRWLPVVRVNWVSVTVAGLWPWSETVLFANILDVRTVTP